VLSTPSKPFVISALDAADLTTVMRGAAPNHLPAITPKPLHASYTMCILPPPTLYHVLNNHAAHQE
jgi:hypothetical protein